MYFGIYIFNYLYMSFSGKKIFASIQRKIVFHTSPKKRKMLFRKLLKLLLFLFIFRFLLNVHTIFNKLHLQ